MVDVRRTPEDRFGEPAPAGAEVSYTQVEVDGTPLRLAHVALGPVDGPTVVLLHGEPTWSHLWREVLPPLAQAGLRAIAPDLVGFGRSDKPTAVAWYTPERLAASLEAHLDAIAPGPLTLVVHDWGGMLGLPWAVEHPDRVERLVITDTGLYSPGGRMSDSWQAFRDFVERTDELPIGFLISEATVRGLSAGEQQAYEAPFPDAGSQAGARALPLLVPRADDDPGAERSWRSRQALTAWEKPTLVLWAAEDRILPPKVGERFAQDIPGCVGFEQVEDAGHFLQEDAGERIGRRIARFVAEQPPASSPPTSSPPA
jgi:haloalkane dehalogenase